MANIEQVPGELNIISIIGGEAFSFSTIHDGDVSADTFAATIDNGGNAVSIDLSISYSASTLKTTIVYTLSAAKSASLGKGILTWKNVQTSGGVARTILRGTWGVC